MARKKGKKKKKGKKGKAEGGRPERAVLRSKVQHLEKEFQKYEALKVSLEQQQKIAQRLYESEVLDKEAVVRHLQRELMKKSEKAETVKAKLVKTLAEHTPKKSSLEQKIVKLKEEFSAMKYDLTEQKNTLASKLSMLEELRLQKDGILMKLEQAEQKLVNEATIQALKLRAVDKEHVLEKQRLNEEYIERVDELFDKFDECTADELSDMIKTALQKCVNTIQKLDKVSGTALTVQEYNFQLGEQEKLLEFETDLDQELEKYLSNKIEKQYQKVQSLAESLDQKKSKIEPTDGQSWECTLKRLHELKHEFLKLHAKWQDLNSLKAEQERYLKVTEDTVANLQKKNAYLISVTANAEKIIRAELASNPDEFGVRNKLLKQFEILMNLQTSIEKDDTDNCINSK